MSAIGPKQTSASAAHMSAFGVKADMAFCGNPLSRSLLVAKRTWLVAAHSLLLTQSGHGYDAHWTWVQLDIAAAATNNRPVHTLPGTFWPVSPPIALVCRFVSRNPKSINTTAISKAYVGRIEI